MMTGPTLPAGFESLLPFVEQFAVETSQQRMFQRIAMSEAERQAFYAAANAQFDHMREYLDGKDIEALDEPDRRLLALLLSYAHVAASYEKQAELESEHRGRLGAFRITRSTSKV